MGLIIEQVLQEAQGSRALQICYNPPARGLDLALTILARPSGPRGATGATDESFPAPTTEYTR